MERTTRVSLVTRDPINLEACIRVDVVFDFGDRTEKQELTCDSESTSFAWTDPPSRVEAHYRYFMIPFGCEEMACWREDTMAQGEADFDPEAAEVEISIERVVNLPF